MTDVSDQSPRQQRRQAVGMTEAGMHSLPGAAPSAGADDDSQGMAEDTRGQLAAVAHRFIHDPQAVIGLLLFFGMAIAAILTGLFWTYGYTTITNTLNAPPSLSHPFGTNTIGGDMFAQVMRGTLQDIEIALLVALMATVLGALVGAIAGFYGGRVDSSLMRFVDLILVIPVLVILILLANIVAKQADNWFWLAIIIGAVSWTYIARLVRADFLTLREREFVEASRALGASNSRLILRHMLPNALGPDHRERHHHRGPGHLAGVDPVLPRARDPTTGRLARPAHRPGPGLGHHRMVAVRVPGGVPGRAHPVRLLHR